VHLAAEIKTNLRKSSQWTKHLMKNALRPCGSVVPRA
jgi:hypothetical protein